ncbi:MAG: hypothetical protein HOI95_11200 [Chromatiales bacterium]|nr:hypothetical protein [Chromatiales bacterium]
MKQGVNDVAVLNDCANPVARETALAEGEEMLRQGATSFNFFCFHRFAMDAMLAINDWNRVDGYASALEDRASEEPLGWTDFFITRGRTLAAFGRGS